MSKKVIDIYDTPEEKSASLKKKMNPKLKKVLVYILCGILGIALAAVVIYLYNVVFSGAPTPEEAVAGYQKAALLYDVDGMIEYSSEYNKVVLYGNNKTSNRLLRSYLNKGYEGIEAQYTEEQISFKLISVLEYEKGDGKYEKVMERYDDKIEGGSEDIKKIAIVSMTVITDGKETTRDYLVVKVGMRWYYAYAGV